MGRQFALTAIQPADVSLMLWLCTEADPSPADWDDALNQVVAQRRRAEAEVRLLVVSDGGAPNAKQRAQLLERTWDGKPGLGSVVTPSLANPLKRGVATALTWLNPSFRFFEPARFREAVAYLDHQAHLPYIWEQLCVLSSELPPTQSIGLIAAAIGQPAPAVRLRA